MFSDGGIEFVQDNFSYIFNNDESKVIGRQFAGFELPLQGLGMVIIFPCFHMDGKYLKCMQF